MREVSIFFHGSCIDGLVSGALAGIVAQEASVRVAGFVPCRYPASLELQTRVRETRAWVVDFRFLLGAERFWDHHPTSLTESTRRGFRGTPLVRLDPTSPSCAQLVAADIDAPPTWVADAVRVAAITDSASYPDARAANWMTQRGGWDGHAPLGILQLAGAAMGWCQDDLLEAQACATLSSAGPDGLLAHDQLLERANLMAAAESKGLEILRDCLRFDDGVARAELELPSSARLNRYASYVLHPDAAFSVILVHQPGGGVSKLTAMRNPWLSIPSPHLGHWMRQHGGGGHARVGSAVYRDTWRQAARAAFDMTWRKLVNFVREHPQWTGSSTSTISSAT